RANRRADSAHRTSGRRCGRDADAARQSAAVDKLQNLERAARSDGSRARLRIIDQVRPLQMNSPRSQVPDFKGRLASETLLDRSTPLLNILGRRVRIESRKADGS